MSPTIDAIKELSGSANTEEIYEKVVEDLQLSDTLLEVINGKTGQSELQYNLAWVRTVLKNKGILAKGGKGIWVLIENSPTSILQDQNQKIRKSEDQKIKMLRKKWQMLKNGKKWQSKLLPKNYLQVLLKD